MDLKNLLKENEGKQLEFKRDLSSPKNVLQTIVAFSNTAGGVVLIGIEDETKNVTGIQHPLKEEEKLANLIFENIRPMIAPSIEILNWRGLNIIKIEVHLSSGRPHYIKAKGLENGVYIRIGSSNRNADVYMTDEIRREVLRKPYDETPLIEYSIDDIDFEMASSQFEPKQLRRKDLETLNLVVNHQKKKVPTAAGMILFGEKREEVFPDAWLQCGRFLGIDKTKILDSLEIHSYPMIAVREALEFIKKHSNLAYEIEEIKRKEIWSKPIVAIREALINAIVHADYSQMGAPIRLSIFDDRVEIENPGILVSGLTVEEMQKGVSKLRNKNIARIFKELGLVEQWGSGVLRIISVCKEYGLPMPKFEEIATHFRVSIYTIAQNQPLVNLKDTEILHLLANNIELSTKDVFQKIKLSRQATIKRMNALLAKGLISVIGTTSQDPNRKYSITQKGKEILKS